MFPLLPFHGSELGQLYAEIGSRIARLDLVRRAGDLGVALILLTVIAIGLYTLLELVPFAIQPPRVG